jgi:hypothetical protein
VTWRRWTTIGILVAIVLALVGWDVYVAVAERGSGNDPSSGGTISEVVLGFAGEHPAIPFALGVVCGHLLWPQRPKGKA